MSSPRSQRLLLPLLAAFVLGLLAVFLGRPGSDADALDAAPTQADAPPADHAPPAGAPPAASPSPRDRLEHASPPPDAAPAPIADFGDAMARVTALIEDPDSAGPDVARCPVPRAVDAGEDAILVQDDRGPVGPFPPVGIVRDDTLLLIGPPGDGTGQALTKGGAVMEISWSFPQDGSPARCEVGGIGDDEWWATVRLPDPCPGLCLLTAQDCRALIWADSEQSWRVQTADDACSLRALVLVDGAEEATDAQLLEAPHGDADVDLTLGPARPVGADDPLAESFARSSKALRHACEVVGEVDGEGILGGCDGA